MIVRADRKVLPAHHERRETERALAYWLRCAAMVGGRPPSPAALDLEAIATAGSEFRFAIATDAVSEDSALVIYGANFARLLQLPAAADFGVPLFRQLPARLLPVFADGCRQAALSGAPVRHDGAVAREGGRRELYRAVFMPVGVNLVFGAFNSRLVSEEAAAHEPPHEPPRPMFRSLAGILRLRSGS